MFKGSVEKSHELCQYRRKIRGFRRFFEIWHMRMDDFSTLPYGSVEKSTLPYGIVDFSDNVCYTPLRFTIQGRKGVVNNESGYPSEIF